jgi:hypothetical protein
MHEHSVAELLQGQESPDFEPWIHGPLVLQTLLKTMDRERRRICIWKLEGYSDSEIAEQLGTTSWDVADRFVRSWSDAIKKLQQGK